MKFSLIKRTLFALLALMMPMAALASNIPLDGHNAWELYVYGDGAAIQSILIAIKLILDPQYGSQTFSILLLFLATVGFLVMAVRAGFDPGKNLLKMFMFVFVVFGVHYATSVETVNVDIHDRFGKPGYTDFIVTGVPAIVGIPSAVISDAGEYLTQEIEQTFQLPNNANIAPMALTTGGAYGIFEKVMQDANNATISDPDLKQSLSAYMTDCVVSAIALNKLSASALMNTPNLPKLLGAAENNGIMTKFYASPAQASNLNAVCTGAPNLPGSGVILSCTQDYSDCLYPEMYNTTNALIANQNMNWLSTGINTPLEQSMASALQMVGSNGSSNQYAGYSSPEGYIMQSAMISASEGAFRHAAAAMGNNSLMMSAAMSQAEQSQRSSWWTAAQIFKDMMGYVFLVLQAFVFAMAPIVVICLMIPGLGAKVFVNYAEILVWLMLWSPLLAIVNFLAMVFGSSQLSGSIGSYGLTMLNKGLVTEQTTNLVIVSQFMATMVPLLAWGLVKGSLAFTEFIMSGIGSAFAQQAGSQSATGNMSLGNESLNNLGMDKFSSVMSAAVGYQAVQAFDGVGRGLTMIEGGGIAATANAAPVTRGFSETKGYGITDKSGHTVQISQSEAQTLQNQNSVASQVSHSEMQKLNAALGRGSNFREGSGASADWSASRAADVASKAAEANDAATTYKADLSASASAFAKAGEAPAGSKEQAGLVKMGLAAGAAANMARTLMEKDDLAVNAAITAAGKHGISASRSAGHDESSSANVSAGTDAARQEALNEVSGLYHSLQSLHSYSSARSESKDYAATFTVSNSESMTESYAGAPDAAGATSGAAAAVAGNSASTASAIGTEHAGLNRDLVQMNKQDAVQNRATAAQTSEAGSALTHSATGAGLNVDSNFMGGFETTRLSMKHVTPGCVETSVMQNGGKAIGMSRAVNSMAITDHAAFGSGVHFFDWGPNVPNNVGLSNIHLGAFNASPTHCLTSRYDAQAFVRGLSSQSTIRVP